MSAKLLRILVIILLLYEIKCNIQTSQGVYNPIMRFRRKRSGEG
jgi:hypothetical protein